MRQMLQEMLLQEAFGFPLLCRFLSVSESELSNPGRVSFGIALCYQELGYLNAELAAEGTDVLAFWKANQLNYPTLAAMAKDYLTVQASSVPSERAFSTGVDLVTPDRCSLTGETIEKAQILKFHL